MPKPKEPRFVYDPREYDAAYVSALEMSGGSSARLDFGWFGAQTELPQSLLSLARRRVRQVRNDDGDGLAHAQRGDRGRPPRRFGEHVDQRGALADRDGRCEGRALMGDLPALDQHGRGGGHHLAADGDGVLADDRSVGRSGDRELHPPDDLGRRGAAPCKAQRDQASDAQTPARRGRHDGGETSHRRTVRVPPAIARCHGPLPSSAWLRSRSRPASARAWLAGCAGAR